MRQIINHDTKHKMMSIALMQLYFFPDIRDSQFVHACVRSYTANMPQDDVNIISQITCGGGGWLSQHGQILGVLSYSCLSIHVPTYTYTYTGSGLVPHTARLFAH